MNNTILPESTSYGVLEIAREREEQKNKHSYGDEHDNVINDSTQLRDAAVYILTNSRNYFPKGWSTKFAEKVSHKTYKEKLIVAGALIAAEIDRLERINDKQNGNTK